MAGLRERGRARAGERRVVELEIVETDPGVRGDTSSGGTKPAKLETGAVVQVPFHIKEGDTLKIDTRDYSYAEKANK